MLRVIFTFSLCLTLQTLQILWILPKNGSRIWSPLIILTAACLVQVTIISILDYCNSFLTGLSIVYPQHGSQSRPVKRLVAILSSLCSEPTSDSFVTWSKTKVVTVTCKSQHDPAPVTSWTHLPLRALSHPLPSTHTGILAVTEKRQPYSLRRAFALAVPSAWKVFPHTSMWFVLLLLQVLNKNNLLHLAFPDTLSKISTTPSWYFIRLFPNLSFLLSTYSYLIYYRLYLLSIFIIKM